MASVGIQRPALHKIIHRYRPLGKSNFCEEQEWVSGDETEDEDNFSVYSDEYLTQEEEYSDDNDEDEEYDKESLKRHSVNLCATGKAMKRRKF
tara:strand:- start:891 stop:1169 length:279 start_codon:yes stop_codon:yes gene_type:complete